MSVRAEPVTTGLLRAWGLPDPGDSKKDRGEVMVVGGSRTAPGAVLLAGEAALRVGAGRVGLAVPGSIDAHVGVSLPEAGVFTLPDDPTDPIGGRLGTQLSSADAVLVGPGFDDPDETRATLMAVAALGPHRLVLDAFALGVLPDIDRDALPGEVILSPNEEEAGILLGRRVEHDDVDALHEIAVRFAAVVCCYGLVVHPDGRAWRIETGGPELGTSGSGDVLAGAIAGLAGRGMTPERAAVWGAWAHATAGGRVGQRMGLGLLARELAADLAPTLRDALE